MPENDEVSFEEVKQSRNIVTQWQDATFQQTRSFMEMEKKNATEEEEGTMEKMIMEMRLHMKKKEDDKAIKPDSKVKLPKLIITTFNGTYIDWFRFWNYLKYETDRSELSAVSKCFDLKELISSKVRVIIDGLRFTNQGQTRANNILISKHGKSSEVAKAHIQDIMSPNTHINKVNHYKIRQVTEKWLDIVQAQETKGKLK